MQICIICVARLYIYFVCHCAVQKKLLHECCEHTIVIQLSHFSYLHYFINTLFLVHLCTSFYNSIQFACMHDSNL